MAIFDCTRQPLASFTEITVFEIAVFGNRTIHISESEDTEELTSNEVTLKTSH
jgi:hypothetical protein